MNTKQSEIIIIAAIGHNRVIGKDNRLLWHIPEDLKRFKRLTLSHPVIMGRKTFESIGKPLPLRLNIVITRQQKEIPGVTVVHSLEDALQIGKQAKTGKIFVLGGGEIYSRALDFADRLYLTLVDSDVLGDTLFPAYDHIFKKEMARETHSEGNPPYVFVELTR